MLKTVCIKHCADPFCAVACPSGALIVTEDEIKVDSDKCHGCGICRLVCMTWSRDHVMRTKSRFWLAGRL
ncbi:MAG: 4Fe-4S binding protein [Chloroflexi bacterium]|nr:4Fe-4S binding protein [Chloroflexota bacterium]